MDQNQAYQDIEQQLKLQKQIELIELTAKQYLAKESIARLGNIKAVNPELAVRLSSFIVQLAQSGQLTGTISDEKFKEVLMLSQGQKKEFKFKRV